MKTLTPPIFHRSQTNSLKPQNFAFPLHQKPRSLFNDSLSTTFPDPEHSIGENRYLIIGLSGYGQLLVVSHTDRRDRVRIISARNATRQERRFYEEGS